MKNCDGTRDYNYRICNYISTDLAACREYFETNGDEGTCDDVYDYTAYLTEFQFNYNTRPWCYHTDWEWDP